MSNEQINLEGVVSLLTEKLINWYEIFIKSIPNLVAAIAIFILFVFIAKGVKNLSSKLIPRITKNKAVINLLNTIFYFAILILGLFVSLEILHLDKTVTSILAGAGVIGLSLGFAFQEIASNFVSGILIAFREPYKIGDIVEVDDYFGEITKINLRTTSIMTFQGLEVLIPNKTMFTEPFINLTTTPTRRVDISVGVSYGDNLDKVAEITTQALNKVEERIDDMDVDVFFQEFGASSINLSARFWVKYPENKAYLKAKHNAIIEIKKAFDQNKITIPFPIRTLDFGIKGGQTLTEAMPGK